MLDWLQSHWETILGTIMVLVGGAYVPIMRTLIIKGIKALLSETFLKALFISLASKYVKSTKTKLDDIWLEALKKSL